jgi:hypothetical protein
MEVWKLKHWRERLLWRSKFIPLVLMIGFTNLLIYHMFFIKFSIFIRETIKKCLENKNFESSIQNWLYFDYISHVVILATQTWVMFQNDDFTENGDAIVINFCRFSLGFCIAIVNNSKLQLAYDLFVVCYSLLGYNAFFTPPFLWYLASVFIYAPSFLCTEFLWCWIYSISNCSRMDVTFALVLLIAHSVAMIYLIHLFQSNPKRQTFLMYVPGLLIYIITYFIVVPTLFATYRFANACYVCQEPFTVKPCQKIVVLNCGHDLHQKCFENSVRNDFVTCGLCREYSLKVEILEKFRF